MERSGCGDAKRAADHVYKLARTAQPSHDQNCRYESGGWQLVINAHGWVETIYRRHRMENKATLKKRRFDFA